MEALVTLGETLRTVATFGDPILYDDKGRSYQHIFAQYAHALRRERSFDHSRMVALDFKLPRAKGKQWPEPPRLHEELQLFEPQLNELMCTARANYVHLGRRRSVGVIYLEEVRWVHPVIDSFLLNKSM